MSALALRYPERRTGFDPRVPSPLLERLRDDQRALLVLIAAFIGLSLLDWAFTVAELRAGIAVEANAVLAALMGQNWLVAGVFKLAATLAVALVIWRARTYRLALATLVLGVALYAAVVVYHVWGTL